MDVDAVLWLAAEAEVDVPTPEFLSQICMGKKAIFGAKVQKFFYFCSDTEANFLKKHILRSI